MNKLLFRKKVYRVYVYNISGGVANIFYQSCVQIDNNQQVYEAHIQVPRCNSILKAGSHESQKLSHFILIDVQMSTQTTVPRQLILMSVCCLPFGQDLAFDRCFHPSPNISSSIIYTLFYYYYHNFYFYTFKCSIHQIATKLLIYVSLLY